MLKGFKSAAEIAGVSVATLKKWQRAGKFPPGLVTKITQRTVFFNEQILRAWLSGELQTVNETRRVGRPRRERHDSHGKKHPPAPIPGVNVQKKP